MARLLKPLGGEAHPDGWHFQNVGEEGPLPNPADPIFPIISQNENKEWEMVGTGFYVASNGLFVTARHVIEDVLNEGQQVKPLAILHLWSESGLFGPQQAIVRPIVQCWLGEQPNPTPIYDPIIYGLPPPDFVDIALGVPMTMSHKATGQTLTNSRMALTWAAPDAGVHVGTYAFPNQAFHPRDDGKQILQFRPDFYRGRIEEVAERQGSSVPYPHYRVNFRIHAAASGGPVFSSGGSVVGVNCKEMHGSNYGFAAQIRCLEGAFIDNASLETDGPLGRVTFSELVERDVIRVGGFLPRERTQAPSGRIVHLSLLPTAQEILVEVGLHF
jgi:hypothetical protein